MEQKERMYDLCVFKGCPNEVGMWGRKLFPFPNSTNPLYATWLDNCGNKSIIGHSGPATRKFGLCGDHFTPDSFYDEDRKKLRRDAVPEPYSPTFKRSYPLSRANLKIYDHNYAMVSSETEISLINFKRPFNPMRNNDAQSSVAPSASCENDNCGKNAMKTALEIPKAKRGRPLGGRHSGKNLIVEKNDGKIKETFFPIKTSNDLTSAELEAVSRLVEGLTGGSLRGGNSKQNVSGNKRGEKRRSGSAGDKVLWSRPQVGVSGNGEVGILRKTNDELRTQNKLLKKLNGQLKQKMKRYEDRNSMLKIMLEKVSSIDGFLDLHRCFKKDVRNMIKKEIHKCKMPSGSD